MHYLMSRRKQKSTHVTIDDLNTKYVFASKGTLAVYLNPNLQ